MISVVIPNYNHAAFLKQRIDSVLHQTFQDFEVIILDDCSTDNSRQIIEAYRNHPKVAHIVYNTVNSGSTFKQWKKGIELAKGEWIWIAESDDYCASNLLETLVELAGRDSQIAVAYCGSFDIDSEENLLPQSPRSLYTEYLEQHKRENEYVIEGWREFAEKLIIQCTIPNASAVLVRKHELSKHLPHSIAFRLAGDWLMWSNIAAHNKVAYTSLRLNYFRHHAANVRSAMSKSVEKEYEFIEIRSCFDAIIDKLSIPNLKKQNLHALNRQMLGIDLGYMSMSNVRNKQWMRGLKNLMASMNYTGFNAEFLKGFVYWAFH